MQRIANTTQVNVEGVYQHIFAPWVKELGLRNIEVSRGKASAIMPHNPALQWSAGAICGQAIMAAIDTITALATATTEREPRGDSTSGSNIWRISGFRPERKRYIPLSQRPLEWR